MTDVRNPTSHGPCIGIASHCSYSFGTHEAMEADRAAGIELKVEMDASQVLRTARRTGREVRAVAVWIRSHGNNWCDELGDGLHDERVGTIRQE